MARGLTARPVRPLILGLPGPVLDKATLGVIERLNPAGFILFKRNCISREQVEALCAELHRLSPLNPPLIFIDQEGGRVNRIKWEPYMAPPAATIGAIYNANPQKGLEAAEMNGYLLGAQLAVYGITANCLPVADVLAPGADPVIGNRSFGHDPESVAALCAATMKGLLAGGVWPVIKHAPGHGRAGADSHKTLPRVSASLRELEATDFAPFATNNRSPFVMTAHVAFDALGGTCATTSPSVIEGLLRGKLGMTGIIISDDLFMQALTGPLMERAQSSLAAGCDLLICGSSALDGGFDEAQWGQIQDLENLPDLGAATRTRLAALPPLHTPQPATLAEAFQTMQSLLAA